MATGAAAGHRRAWGRGGVPAPGRPPWLSSLAARLQGPSLDGELACGVEPWRTPLHTARSLQITGARARRSLAKSLDRLLERAQTPTWSTAVSAAVPVDRRAVLGARARVEDLSRRLRDSAPVSTSGIAALRDLLCDGDGPIYNPLSGVALGQVLASIRDSLDVAD